MIQRLWHRLFLTERSSFMLSLFRVAVALTTIFHVFPSLVHLEDNYLPGAFKTLNPGFFPVAVLEWVQLSPSWVIVLMVWVFLISSFLFLIGWRSQISCIIMTLACYYFYALNAFHVGTLSWDILLVTLFLMCLTSYHGDYFSLDALRGGNLRAFDCKRPYFIQRLLQLQIGFTFFYTALYKIAGEGNWITGNPIHYLMNYPHAGVVKTFMLKDVLFDKPTLCYVIGIAIVVIEFAMIFLLFWRRTRACAVYLGIFFHILLILTLDVPAIFFFLFPAQLLLFFNPDEVVAWTDRRRSYHEQAPRPKMIYDGKCQFCRDSVEKLRIMDLFSRVEILDLHQVSRLEDIHPELTREKAMSRVYLAEPGGRLSGGFYVFRRISWMLPMMMPLIPIFYFPGMGVIGSAVYRWVANNRYLFHFKPACRDNSCFRK